MEVVSTLGCPRCSEAIDNAEGLSICRSCGWMPTTLEKKQVTQHQKSMLRSFAIAGAIMVVSFIHIVNWDKHSLEIIPLKTKQILGAVDNVDLNKIAEICADRFKHDCTEAALTDLAYKYNEKEAFEKLGLLQRKMKNWSGAAKSYEMALSILHKNGSEDQFAAADIYYGLAKSYDSLGNTNMAVDYYDRAIKAKPGVIQVTVTEDFVNLLKRLGDTDTAKKVVAEARKRSGQKTLFAALE